MMLDERSIETLLKGRTEFTLFNKSMTPCPTLADIPTEILDRLNGEQPGIYLASREDLDDYGIVLSHDQLGQFQKGEPILIIVDSVVERPALKRGRRQIEGLERRVQQAHAIQTYIGVERLCEWIQSKRPNPPKIEAQRRNAMEMLAEKAWIKNPRSASRRPTSDDESLTFYPTQRDAGGRLVAEWYPFCSTPDDLSRSARNSVRSSLIGMRWPAIEEAISREMDMNRFMLRCLRQATTLVLIEHEVSKQLSAHDRMTKGQQAVLAGVVPDKPSLYEAVRAAIDGDFDPSELFRSLRSFRELFELARGLGRRGRGFDVRLEEPQVHEMRRQIRLRDEFDEGINENPEGAQSAQHAAALVITQAAYELFPLPNWIAVLDEAIRTEEAVTLTGRPAASRG